MNYSEVKERLLSKEMNISIPGTERIKKVLFALGNPQKDIEIVHVVGTNGKGSTSTMLAQILGCNGIKAGLFNSPFITELTEYISYYENSELKTISFDEFADLASEIFCACEVTGERVTHFEFITILAVLFFKKADCKISVFEAGLGGINDATNIFDKSVCTVITSISLEHTKVLGNSIEEIVENKAGICEQGGTVISNCYLAPYMNTNDSINNNRLTIIDDELSNTSDTFNQRQKLVNKNLELLSTAKLILNYCDDNKINFIPSDLSLLSIKSISKNGICFDFGKYENLHLSSSAVYQTENAALAITASTYICDYLGYELNEQSVRVCLDGFKLKARFEKIHDRPEIFIDGAHNPACARALRETVEALKNAVYTENYITKASIINNIKCNNDVISITNSNEIDKHSNSISNYNTKDMAYVSNTFAKNKLYIVTGVMADKDITGIYDNLSVIAGGFIVVDNGIERAMKTADLSKFLSRYEKPVINAYTTEIAAAIIKNFEDKEASFIFAGTLYMSDAFRKSIEFMFNEDLVQKFYNDCVNRLTSKSFYSSNSNLPDMKKLLAVFGNPQERVKYIHIAGTNGKGSTSKLLYELIHRNGLRTGLFTSPYIEIFNERIQLNDKNIENELLFSICNQVITVQNQLGLDLNQFALLTCIAFIYYSAKNADYVVLETGLGGTFDPTNIISKPECCIITNIGLDHTQVLGNSISEIAAAKAGIIKENVPVVCYPVCDEALKVISDTAKSKNAQLQLFEAKVNEDDSFILNNEHYTTSLAGGYQCLNACNALTAYEILAKKDLRLADTYAYKNAALNNTKWKGRLEIISKKPLTYVDGGHNPQCIAAVTDYIAKKYSDRRKFYIAGFMKDKAYDEMVRILVENADELHLVPVKNVRSLQTFELTNLKYVDNIKVYADSSLSEAYQKAVKNCDDQGVIIIIGSLYQLKEAYDLTLSEKSPAS